MFFPSFGRRATGRSYARKADEWKREIVPLAPWGVAGRRRGLQRRAVHGGLIGGLVVVSGHLLDRADVFAAWRARIRTSLNTMDLSKERSDPFREEHNRSRPIPSATKRCGRFPTGYPALAGFSPTPSFRAASNWRIPRANLPFLRCAPMVCGCFETHENRRRLPGVGARSSRQPRALVRNGRWRS
jgi:hypothetical protein